AVPLLERSQRVAVDLPLVVGRLSRDRVLPMDARPRARSVFDDRKTRRGLTSVVRDLLEDVGDLRRAGAISAKAKFVEGRRPRVDPADPLRRSCLQLRTCLGAA